MASQVCPFFFDYHRSTGKFVPADKAAPLPVEAIRMPMFAKPFRIGALNIEQWWIDGRQLRQKGRISEELRALLALYLPQPPRPKRPESVSK